MQTAVSSPFSSASPWDAVAEGYTAELVPTLERYAWDALRLARVERGDHVIDVATGPATLALCAASIGVHATGIDVSTAMIAHARRRVIAKGYAEMVRLMVGDCHRLPFSDETFDNGFSMFGLMFFENRQTALRDIVRVTRKGGRIVVANWLPFGGILGAMMKRLLERVNGGRPSSQPPMLDQSQVFSDMQIAGCRNVEVHEVSHVLGAYTVREFFGSIERSNAPVVMLRTKLGEAVWSDVKLEVCSALERELGVGPHVVEGRALLGLGQR